LKKNQLYSYVPEGAFYLLVDISRYSYDSDRFARELLEKEKVAVAPGRTFGPGGQKYVRISLATDDQNLVTGLERVCHLING
jgi:aspartate/methionine/tyrosine aminotransferase